jgi:hypothetical protein
MAFTWTYAGQYSGGSFDVTINTDSTLTNGGYVATSVSGSFNGVSITGIAPISVLRSGNGFYNDNLSFVSTTAAASVDESGVGLTLANGNYESLSKYYGFFLIESYDSNKNLLSSGIVNGATYTSGAACFLRGTNICTTTGDVAVEALRAGDLVITASGASAPIVWIGHRAMDPGVVANHPIRLRAGSFGPGLPARDLYLSPEHAVFVDGLLVPALHLVNGGSIARVAVDEIVYFHVLLARHDVILSEGLPTESFLDDDNIAHFDNAGDAPVLPPYMEPCARRITQGARLEAIRQGLEAAARVVVAA